MSVIDARKNKQSNDLAMRTIRNYVTIEGVEPNRGNEFGQVKFFAPKGFELESTGWETSKDASELNTILRRMGRPATEHEMILTIGTQRDKDAVEAARLHLLSAINYEMQNLKEFRVAVRLVPSMSESEYAICYNTLYGKTTADKAALAALRKELTQYYLPSKQEEYSKPFILWLPIRIILSDALVLPSVPESGANPKGEVSNPKV